MIPAFIQDGKVEIAQPCTVPWNEMDAAEGKNRFCHACQKEVHNITGMSRDEIYALLASDPGNVCVNFVDIRLPKDTETKWPKSQTRKAKPIRYIAASAAILLLLQQSNTAPLAQNRIELNPVRPADPQKLSSNTIVSGIILDRNGNAPSEDFEVILSCEGTEVTRLKTRGGMFATDLKDHLSPADMITISVLPGPVASSPIDAAPAISEATAQSVPLTTIEMDELSWSPNFGHWVPSKWQGGNMSLRLADAQNIQLPIDYQAGYSSYVERLSGTALWIDLRPITVSVIGMDEFVGKQPKKSKPLDQSCTDR